MSNTLVDKIQVGVSVFKILLHVTRPNTVVMGNIPGTSIYRNMARYNDAVRIPSFLIIAVEAPIYFANSTYLQERYIFFSVAANVNLLYLLGLNLIKPCYRIGRWIREEEEWLASNSRSSLKCVILDMTG